MNSSEQASIKWRLHSLGKSFGQMQSQDASSFQTLRTEVSKILLKLQQQQKSESNSGDLHEENAESLMSQIEVLSNKVDGLVKAGGRLNTQFHLIASLIYERMEARGEKINEAHAKTFEWILDPRVRLAEMVGDDNFIEWLTSGDSDFWISGKAGSGKSTLMKFISHHATTVHALGKWAGAKILVMANFYF